MSLAALFSNSLPIFVAIGGLVVLVIPWLIKSPRLAIVLLFSSLIAGQLIRLPLPGQGGGLLLSDVAAVGLILSALFHFLFSGSREVPSIIRQLLLVVAPFIFWSAFTLLMQASALGFSNTFIAGSYWVRLTTLLLLLPALTFFFRMPPLCRYAWRGLYLTIGILTLLGIVQLIFLPNLAPYSSSGWDPHQLRLVSTWIDPNFFGAFLVMGLAVVILGVIRGFHKRAIFALVIVAALLGTQSRSALVALVVSLLFTVPFFLILFAKKIKRRQLVFFASSLSMFILFIVVIAIILLPRFVGLIAIDPTVQARVASIQSALPIIADNSWIGVGYNAYQFAARDAGTGGGWQNHSRAGTDNSLLTIWATTGIVGLFLFLVPWMFIVHRFIVDLQRYKQLVSFMGLLCVVILFVHAQFVNSLIYSHLLITLIIIVALSISQVKQEGV